MAYFQNIEGGGKPAPVSKSDFSVCSFFYRVVFLAFLGFCLMPVGVFAQGFPPVGGGGTCTGMVNEQGFQGQQSAVNNALYVCSGGVWVEQPLILGTTASACNATWSGGLRYSSAQSCIELCNGTSWQCMGGGGLTGPSGCANIGDLCADGTVFAGYHPITQMHLFIPTTDQEQPGSPGIYTMNWKNAIGTNDISTDSKNDGQVNHTNRGGAIGDFQAFQACEDLVFGGHGDWYLPSQVELYYLWAVRTTIEAGGNITNFQNAYYWSSTEFSTSTAWRESFSSGSHSNDDKAASAYRVRCVRR